MTAVQITDVARNLLRDASKGLVTDTAVHYVAIGTGSTAPGASDKKLVNEVFRKSVTSFADGASVGEALITMYLSPGEQVGTGITEVGWFAGSGATSAKDSGVLIARVLYSHSHTANESINLQLDSQM